MKAVVRSSLFQPGEGPSRGLLRDYEPSDGPFSSSTEQGSRFQTYQSCLSLGAPPSLHQVHPTPGTRGYHRQLLEW